MEPAWKLEHISFVKHTIEFYKNDAAKIDRREVFKTERVQCSFDTQTQTLTKTNEKQDTSSRFSVLKGLLFIAVAVDSTVFSTGNMWTPSHTEMTAFANGRRVLHLQSFS